MYIRRQLRNFRAGDPNLATKKHKRHRVITVPFCAFLWLSNLFALAVAAVAAEVAAACMLQLSVALGADADHVRHDGAGDGFLGVKL